MKRKSRDIDEDDDIDEDHVFDDNEEEVEMY